MVLKSWSSCTVVFYLFQFTKRIVLLPSKSIEMTLCPFHDLGTTQALKIFHGGRENYKLGSRLFFPDKICVHTLI